jgi:hypothetical protein
MLDGLIGEVIGRAVFGRLGRSQRAQVIARVFFGLLGGGLGALGAAQFLRQPVTPNVAFHGSVVLLFIFLSCFCLFNVALGQRWRWPGFGFLGSLVSMFVTRIAFGA